MRSTPSSTARRTTRLRIRRGRPAHPRCRVRSTASRRSRAGERSARQSRTFPDAWAETVVVSDTCALLVLSFQSQRSVSTQAALITVPGASCALTQSRTRRRPAGCLPCRCSNPPRLQAGDTVAASRCLPAERRCPAPPRGRHPSARRDVRRHVVDAPNARRDNACLQANPRGARRRPALGARERRRRRHRHDASAAMTRSARFPTSTST